MHTCMCMHLSCACISVCLVCVCALRMHELVYVCMHICGHNSDMIATPCCFAGPPMNKCIALHTSIHTYTDFSHDCSALLLHRATDDFASCDKGFQLRCDELVESGQHCRDLQYMRVCLCVQVCMIRMVFSLRCSQVKNKDRCVYATKTNTLLILSLVQCLHGFVQRTKENTKTNLGLVHDDGIAWYSDSSHSPPAVCRDGASWRHVSVLCWLICELPMRRGRHCILLCLYVNTSAIFQRLRHGQFPYLYIGD
jgi:hypothetical protein